MAVTRLRKNHHYANSETSEKESNTAMIERRSLRSSNPPDAARFGLFPRLSTLIRIMTICLCVAFVVYTSSTVATLRDKTNDTDSSTSRLNESHTNLIQYQLRRNMEIQAQQRQEEQKKDEYQGQTILIPHNLIFVDTRYERAEQLPSRFYQNVQKTIQHYRTLWATTKPFPINRDKMPSAMMTTKTANTTTTISDTDETAATLWFGNDACLQVLNLSYPALVPYYEKETNGRYCSNICRIAALYYHGGYYFDTDMESVQAVPLDAAPHNEGVDAVSFCSVYEHSKNGLFNSFIAAKAKHPILKTTLNLMLAYYEKKIPIRTTNMGTSLLLDGLIHTPIEQRGTIKLLQEVYLVQDTLLSPMIPRRSGRNGIATGNGCDYVVRGDDLTIYFYSRMIGVGTFCNHKTDGFQNKATSNRQWFISLFSKTKPPTQFRVVP